MKFLGIDAGRSGACALLNTVTNEVEVVDTEVEFDGSLNCNWFFGKLTEWEPDSACIEGVYKPNSLVHMKGEFSACLKLFQVPLTTVAIVTWKRKMLGENTSNKKVSIDRCLQLLPQADLNRPTPKLQKPTVCADRAEAVLLAAYLQRTL